ncbi:helix-turn-helix domain-containing protein [Sodalinema gerasimenkoae]|uniref:helix-turn-helix domain-containing protein n=1 Tax=Sodalinema gerasimenkoae TaxID=2862348 RepID=UPI00135B8B4E|nr:helix-turn-helix transcriptional regulator [Sodalinema gerasimenkoae]
MPSQDSHSSNSANRGSPRNTAANLDRRLGEIEQQLLQSPAYQMALNGLKEMFGDAGYAAQMLMHEVSREAIALALRETSLTTALPSGPPISQPISQSPPEPSEAERAARNRYLYRLGKYLRAQRCRRHLSLVQLHHRTRIPINHLHALESGHISHYPQSPAYLRGSLHLWATALGLNADSIIAKLPITPSRPPLPPPPPPQPRPVPPPTVLVQEPLDCPWWWRSLACGTPLLATLGLALWFANLPPASQHPPQLPEADSGARRPQTPPSSREVWSESDREAYGNRNRPQVIPPESLLQRRD